MSETIKASFEVGHNRNISGIIEANSESFSCWSHDRFYIDEHSNIYGVTDKAQNVSLLNCLGQTSHIVGKNNQSHSSNVYAHTIVLGNDKVCPDNDKFCSILIHVANPATGVQSRSNTQDTASLDSELIELRQDTEKALAILGIP